MSRMREVLPAPSVPSKAINRPLAMSQYRLAAVVHQTFDRHRALDRFLDESGLERQRLVEEVGDAFGVPSLIVATGSVIQGFGSSTSDLDVYVLVPRPVTGFPLLSYIDGARIDIAWHLASA